MRIINTLADITLLEKTNTLPQDYLNLIRQHFQDLMDFNIDGETEEEFTLEQCGPIIVLEPGDNVKDLSIVGLNSTEKGLLGTVPESVQYHILCYCLMTNHFHMIVETLEHSRDKGTGQGDRFRVPGLPSTCVFDIIANCNNNIRKNKEKASL